MGWYKIAQTIGMWSDGCEAIAFQNIWFSEDCTEQAINIAETIFRWEECMLFKTKNHIQTLTWQVEKYYLEPFVQSLIEWKGVQVVEWMIMLENFVQI